MTSDPTLARPVRVFEAKDTDSMHLMSHLLLIIDLDNQFACRDQDDCTENQYCDAVSRCVVRKPLGA